MTNELSVEDAIEALYTVRAYYASLTAGYPKGKDCRGIGDVMCSEIANSCLMAIKALESQRWIPVSEPPKEDGKYLVSRKNEENIWVEEAYYSTTSRTTFPKGFSIIKDNFSWRINNVIAWRELPQPYAESEDKE